jgi:hypothetical protein
VVASQPPYLCEITTMEWCHRGFCRMYCSASCAFVTCSNIVTLSNVEYCSSVSNSFLFVISRFGFFPIIDHSPVFSSFSIIEVAALVRDQSLAPLTEFPSELIILVASDLLSLAGIASASGNCKCEVQFIHDSGTT